MRSTDPSICVRVVGVLLALLCVTIGVNLRAQDKTAQMQARAGAIDDLLASGALSDASLPAGPGGAGMQSAAQSDPQSHRPRSG